MTRDDILRWARESGLASSSWVPDDEDERVLRELAHFARLVAAHERAACAAICDEEAKGINPKYGKIMAMMIGEMIRARGDE